ncbi:MAG: response regulator [Methanoculleaceae archaeon]
MERGDERLASSDRQVAFTVLVVDDDEMIARLYGLTVERLGHRPIVVTSGRECLRVLEKEEPDIILLDILMKPMDGWTVLREIRGSMGLHQIPVVMVTGKMLTPDDILKFGLQIDGYVMKPFRLNDLNTILEMAAAHKEEWEIACKRAMAAGLNRDESRRFADLTVHIPVLQRLYDLLTRTAGTPDAGDGTKEFEAVRRFIRRCEAEHEALARQIGKESDRS